MGLALHKGVGADSDIADCTLLALSIKLSHGAVPVAKAEHFEQQWPQTPGCSNLMYNTMLLSGSSGSGPQQTGPAFQVHGCRKGKRESADPSSGAFSRTAPEPPPANKSHCLSTVSPPPQARFLSLTALPATATTHCLTPPMRLNVRSEVSTSH